MTPNSWDAWRAQEPPADFADRAVAAILRDRRAKPAWRGRRAAIVVAAAVVGAAGAAWGWTALSTPAPPPLEPAPSVLEPAPPSLGIAAPGPSPSAPVIDGDAPKPFAARPRPRPAVSPAASSAPDAGHRPIVPRCSCAPGEGICDCL